MVDFQFQEMFPQAKPATPFRRLSGDFVAVGEYRGSGCSRSTARR